MSRRHPPFFDHLTRPHRYPGRLIVFEGIAGSGKSTQLQLAARWLESLEYAPYGLAWGSAALIQSVTKRGQQKHDLTPTTFGLVHATDLAHRLSHAIIPRLKAGMLVLAERYVFSALSQDAVRGCSRSWDRKLYRFAPRPDAVFYFRTPAELALERIRNCRAELMDFEAGLDLGLHTDPAESFRIFQGRIGEEYEKMIEEFRLTAINGTAAVGQQQRLVRQVLSEKLAEFKARGA